MTTPIGRFLYANGITRKELSEYLGVTPQFVSNLASGKSELSGRLYKMLLENDKSWNITMLSEDPATISIDPSISDMPYDIPADFVSLFEQLKVKDEQIAKLLDIIKNLSTK